MKLKTWITIGASVVLLAACNEAIEFPGLKKADTSETTDSPEITDTPPVSEPASETTTTDPDASAETDTTTPNTDTGTDTTTPDGNTPPVDEVDNTVPGPANLREINAKICGASTTETMTVAELTGAGAPVDATFGTATVNGNIAHRTDFPGIVKMEPKTDMVNGGVASGHCGATRIAQNWFITAAHCLDEQYDRIELITGTDTLSSPIGKHVIAATTVCHNSYGGSRNQYANDIALVHVSDTVLTDLADIPIARFGATQKPLGAANYQTVDMAGWGLTGFDENLSNDLLTARLALVGSGPAVINVSSLDGAGPCVGDSGGPLYITEDDGTKTVVGVLSVVEQNTTTGAFCEGQYNGRYTNLQGFAGWINDVISACDNNSALCISQP